MASIVDQIGGPDAIGPAVELLYEKVLADPEVRGYYANTDMAKLKTHQ